MLALLFMLGACSPFQLVNSEVYNNADLAQYHTFRIVTPDMGKLPPGMQMVTYYNIAAAIRQEMVMRGFTEDPSSPLLINIAVTTHREIQTEPLLPPAISPTTVRTIPIICGRATTMVPTGRQDIIAMLR